MLTAIKVAYIQVVKKTSSLLSYPVTPNARPSLLIKHPPWSCMSVTLADWRCSSCNMQIGIVSRGQNHVTLIISPLTSDNPTPRCTDVQCGFQSPKHGRPHESGQVMEFVENHCKIMWITWITSTYVCGVSRNHISCFCLMLNTGSFQLSM